MQCLSFFWSDVLLVSGQRDIVDPSLSGLIRDLNKKLGLGLGVRADDYLGFGLFGVQSLDIGTHRADINASTLKGELVALGNSKYNIGVF